MGFSIRASISDISIHALREEGDRSLRSARLTARHFYPRPPRGGRRCVQLLNQRIEVISIHALREEGDTVSSLYRSSGLDFYPRPPRGGRRCRQLRLSRQHHFYPRPPRGGRPMPPRRGYISIHALREEGDQEAERYAPQTDYFYPRPPRGGRPCRLPWSCWQTSHFYPRPPRGGRLYVPANVVFQENISIHALREEGDRQSLRCRHGSAYFYPRPPRGGRPVSTRPTP